MILVLLLLLTIIPISKKPIPKNNLELETSSILKNAELINQKCKNAKDKEICYADELEIVTKSSNLELATKILFQLQKIDPTTQACHFMAHKISISETQKNPSQWKELIGKVDPLSCSAGFVHGIIEAYTSFDPTFEINKATLEETCKYIEIKSAPGMDQACTHIMGHLLLSQNLADTPKSIEVCKQITERLQYECYSGVFMENMTRENLDLHGIASRIQWNSENTLKQETICLQYSGRAGNACWREISHMFAATESDDPIKVYSLCQKAPSSQSKEDCYLHAVAVMAISHNFKSENFKLLCTPYDNNKPLLKKCLNDVLWIMMNSSLEMIKNAVIFCDSFSEEFHRLCYSEIGNYTEKLNSTQEKEKLCSNVPENYKNLCLKNN